MNAILNNKLSWIVFILIGICLGCFIKNIPIIKIDTKIDLAEAFNVVLSLITLGIAIHISHVLERKKKKEEYIFGFLIQKVDEIKVSISDLIKTCELEDTPIYKINSKIKIITLSYLDLKNIMSLVNMTADNQLDHDIMLHINHLKLLCLEKTVTKFGTNIIPYTDEESITINESKLTYSEERKDQIFNFTKQIVNKIFQIIIK